MSNRSIYGRIAQAIKSDLTSELLTLIDVGAARGRADRWDPWREVLRVVGFEPGKEEFNKLDQTDSHIWLNTALSSTEETRSMYVTKYWSNSSLLKPNFELVSTLEWGDGHEITSEHSIKCQSLDGILESKQLDADFLKIDTQGSELEILHGSKNSLNKNIVVVEVEVEFCELYKSQSLFAEVDIFLRQSGFYLHDLGNILYVKPRGFGCVGGPKGRIISADALYFRDVTLESQNGFLLENNKKAYALLVAYLAYGYPELAQILLNRVLRADSHMSRGQQISTLLSDIIHPSSNFRLLTRSDILARLGRKMWHQLHTVRGSLWDSPLGNKLI